MTADGAWFELRLAVEGREVPRAVQLAMERLVTHPTVSAVRVYRGRDNPAELLVILHFADERALQVFVRAGVATAAVETLESAGIETETSQWTVGALALAGIDTSMLDTTGCDC